ncbi:hypothetical protein GUITHDRAFT_57412, partial [Guillardia theta CCMP2712]
PDVHEMFVYFDQTYFNGMLQRNAVMVEWSRRMTLCAGQCSYRGRESLCRIALSEPLLKYRTSKEVKETLLHEMIHAWQFVTDGNRDREDHGPKFLGKMEEINGGAKRDMPQAGYAVAVYHTFHQEVNFHRQHWWQCFSCGKQVRRSMNRPPSEKD